MWVSKTCFKAPRRKTVRVKRCSRRLSSAWAAGALKLHHRVQAYYSCSLDPYVNLSLEHFLLQNSGPETYVLLFYINRPSVIIGRNQNPWLEVNLGLLQRGIPYQNVSSSPTSQLHVIDFVRRRSGGGTVFHDQGNVNWSVICPPASFTRNKHAEMVTRALHSLGKSCVRVNERHDIVMLQNNIHQINPEVDSLITQPSGGNVNYQAGQLRKISGSAYKITRSRALHHGTCLLSSPNLNHISEYLTSPAKHYIQAKGVESVKSPVGNIGVKSEDFIDATSTEFFRLYQSGDIVNSICAIHPTDEKGMTRNEITLGYEEMKVSIVPIVNFLELTVQTMAWKYGQTPQFTFSSKTLTQDGTSQIPVFEGQNIPDFSFKARSGIITESDGFQDRLVKPTGNSVVKQQTCLVGVNLFSVENWLSILEGLKVNTNKHQLSHLLGTFFPAKQMLP